jgi:hypothetical protein
VIVAAARFPSSSSEVEMPAPTTFTRRAMVGSLLGLILSGCAGQQPEFKDPPLPWRDLSLPSIR